MSIDISLCLSRWVKDAPRWEANPGVKTIDQLETASEVGLPKLVAGLGLRVQGHKPQAAASMSCCLLEWRGHGEGCVTFHLVLTGMRFEKWADAVLFPHHVGGAPKVNPKKSLKNKFVSHVK
jgi:hypothetical protein